MRAMLLLTVTFLAACGSQEVITSTPNPITVEAVPQWRMDKTDAVNWMLGHQPEGTWVWPLSGGHGMYTIHEGNAANGRITIVKLSPYNYEIFEYDPSFIYHREDHGGRWNGGATWGLPEAHSAYSWRNVDGTKTIWMPRRVTPGAYIANEANKYMYGLGDCRIDRVFRSNLYAHVVGVEMFQGMEALHYFFEHPRAAGSERDTSEHYWYSWEYGWVGWTDGGPIGVWNTPRGGFATSEEACIDTQYGK